MLVFDASSPIVQRLLVRSPAMPIFSPRIDDSHCNRMHSSLTALHCFDNGYVEKQPVAWKEYCAEYWLTLSSIHTHFNTLKKTKVLGKHCEKKVKLLK